MLSASFLCFSPLSLSGIHIGGEGAVWVLFFTERRTSPRGHHLGRDLRETSLVVFAPFCFRNPSDRSIRENSEKSSPKRKEKKKPERKSRGRSKEREKMTRSSSSFPLCSAGCAGQVRKLSGLCSVPRKRQKERSRKERDLSSHVPSAISWRSVETSSRKLRERKRKKRLCNLRVRLFDPSQACRGQREQKKTREREEMTQQRGQGRRAKEDEEEKKRTRNKEQPERKVKTTQDNQAVGPCEQELRALEILSTCGGSERAYTPRDMHGYMWPSPLQMLGVAGICRARNREGEGRRKEGRTKKKKG